MMRLKEIFAINEDYGRTTGYGVAFVDEETGKALRLGANFGRASATLTEVAQALGELARKCAEFAEAERKALQRQKEAKEPSKP